MVSPAGRYLMVIQLQPRFLTESLVQNTYTVEVL